MSHLRGILLCCCVIALWPLRGWAAAETYTLEDGTAVTGEVASADERGLVLRQDSKYLDRIPWTKFSQEAIKKLSTDRRAGPFAEPYVEIEFAVRAEKKEVTISQWPKLERPPAGSLFGALFSSGVGITLLLLIYLANIYAGYEVSVVRADHPALVCGVAAIAPILGPILFLCLPTRIKTRQDEEAEVVAARAAMEAHAIQLATAEAAAAADQEAGGLALAKREGEPTAGLPPTQTFPRGQYTFNRRFFETRFANFFPVIRRESEKDLVLIIKSSRGEFAATRITRIAASDIHLQVLRGGASMEVNVPFVEIQEVVLKHKDAP